jgi:hypothetical protein
MDSTLMGQSFMMNIKEGICNQKGEGCTILAGKVGLMYTDGKPADPSNGKSNDGYHPCTWHIMRTRSR